MKIPIDIHLHDIARVKVSSVPRPACCRRVVQVFAEEAVTRSGAGAPNEQLAWRTGWRIRAALVDEPVLDAALRSPDARRAHLARLEICTRDRARSRLGHRPRFHQWKSEPLLEGR